MKNFILIIIFSFILSSCSIKEEAEKTAITELEGIWKTSCYVDSSDNFSHIKTITVSGTVASYKDEGHSDTSCATDYRLREEAHTFSVGDAGKVLIRIGTTKRTPQSSAAVTAYNSASKCSANDWELNTVKDCTEAENNQGDSVYCLYVLSGTTLYLECNNSAQPTSITIKASDTFTKQ